MMIFASLLPYLTYFAAAGDKGCNFDNKSIFFFLPSPYEYLTGQIDALGACSPSFTLPGDILNIGLALLDILLRVAGFAAVVSIMISGVEYITATGNAEKITHARQRIIYALTGLAIALIATATVTFIGHTLVS